MNVINKELQTVLLPGWKSLSLDYGGNFGFLRYSSIIKILPDALIKLQLPPMPLSTALSKSFYLLLQILLGKQS